ncbi:MAG: YnbE family lipoprotein [Gammaproteobacteria bacterium]|nr:YnbE family lipoprotein [Gammaproteobacteria bacterium]
MYQYLIRIFSATVLLLAVTACTPTVKVTVPDKPITINLNVKIQQEIRVKIDNDLDKLMTKDSGLF